MWKAARNGAVSNHTILGRVLCIECKRPIWTCDLEREDTCEEDEYLLRVRNWDLRAARAKRNNMKPVNPFGDASDRPNPIFWPKDEA